MLVSNTSTLVLLAKIGCIERFIEISPTIEIPEQVKKEALFDKNSYYAKLVDKLVKNKKIVVTSVDKSYVKNIMSEFNLDEGEAATYALFSNKKHKAILTDDGELIKLCKLERVDFICAMAIVIRMYDKKILSKKQAIEKLEGLNKIGRYSEKLYDHFKKEVK